MLTERLRIPDVLSFTPARFRDDRGYLSEIFRKEILVSCGVTEDFIQDNHVFSPQKGVIRGLHFQIPPHEQGKLVRCTRGAILDIAVDIRVGSPTYGKHVATELSEANWRQLWIPTGFAHGYVTLEDNSEIIYKVTNYYAPEHDRGILWDDPALGIDWRISTRDAILSDRDRRLPRLADCSPAFTFVG